jgi:uncharacterized protein (TIGR03067 family)
VTGTLVHVALWTALYGWLKVYLFEHMMHTLRNLDLALPSLTEQILALINYTVDQPALTILALVLLLGVDAFLLYYLGRPSSYRILRECWSGLMVGLPTLAFAFSALALIVPYVKLIEGLTRTGESPRSPKHAERDRLAGTWRLVSVERAGHRTPEDQVPPDRLTIEGARFTWTHAGADRSGLMDLDISRNIHGLHLLDVNGPQAGSLQWGIYQVEGKRLTLCLAPPDTYDEVPDAFASQGTQNELLTFERVAAADAP